MKKCRCGKSVASNARVCPNCGHKSLGVEPQPGKGWSATKISANVYSVAFDFLDGGKPAQAIWSADLTTGAVKYVNQAGKAFSWTPKD